MWDLVYIIFGGTQTEGDEEVGCDFVGLAAELESFLLKLNCGGALFGEGGLGFVEEEEAVVPCAEGLLGGFEMGG